jgi:hypothetical protein
MVEQVPDSIESCYDQCDHLITRNIAKVSHGRCSYEDCLDIRQLVYVRMIEKDFLTRSRELYEARGGGCFERSLYHLVKTVTVNFFEHNTCRPLYHATELEDVQLVEVLYDVAAIAQASNERHLDACECLAGFPAWLKTRRGQYLSEHVSSIEEVFRLWRLYGESRQVTHEIAKALQLTEPWVRTLKAKLKEEFARYCATIM